LEVSKVVFVYSNYKIEMTIQYASDLHLEFSQNRDFIKAMPLKPNGDILLLAGDIVPFAVMHKHADFFTYVSDHFETVYWVPGNHEYYNFDLADKCGTLYEKIRDNVFLVNNIAIQQENIRFIFSTLWSKISPANEWLIENGMNDFSVIKYKGRRFSTALFNELHEESIDFIKQELQTSVPGETVVMSHHVPTFMHYPEQYKGDALNEAFAVELFDFIETQGPDYWIYGHHHTNTSDFEIGKTKLLTNQLGYVRYGEHHSFDLGKVLRLDREGRVG
jgi:predicted phosphohydrolase